MSRRRVAAIVQKELRDYRRNFQILGTMAILPLIFLIQPLAVLLRTSPETAGQISHAPVLIYMLAIPALVPAVVAATAVVGERQQGTLEPVLTTPIRSDELLLGKALAALMPSVLVAYIVFAFLLACLELFTPHVIAGAVIQGPEVLAYLGFTPLVAGSSIWLGIAVSTRVSDVRTAQQLGALASLPSIGVSTLIALTVIPASLPVAVGLGAVLLLVNGLGWRLSARLFDRETLITGTR